MSSKVSAPAATEESVVLESTRQQLGNRHWKKAFARIVGGVDMNLGSSIYDEHGIGYGRNTMDIPRATDEVLIWPTCG